MQGVLFVVDCGKETGLGHFLRCLTIAHWLKELYHIEISVLLNGNSDLPESKKYDITLDSLEHQDAQGKALQVIKHAKRKNTGFIIVDSYVLPSDFYRYLKLNAPTIPLIAIDDIGEKAGMPVIGLISFGLSADKALYPHSLLSHSAIGPEYFPLRREFLERTCARREESRPARRVLVTMGGSDPEHQTVRIAGLLKRIRSLETIDIILGPAYGAKEEIVGVVSDDPRFNLHQAPADIAAIMEKADFAVTGGGTTCNELVYLGVPVVVLVLAENQELMAEAVERYGCGRSLGHFRSISDEQLLHAIEELIGTPSILAVMSQKGREVIDGEGGKRLAEFITDFMNDYHHDSYSTEDVSREYETSASSTDEYSKVKWGSEEGMLNRFHLGIDVIDWRAVRSWLDVGSGTGAFLEEVEKLFTIERFFGVDLSSSLVQFASNKKFKAENRMFKCQSFMDALEGDFDLVTCIGVLQKCGIPLRKAVARLAELARPGGQIFVTTKNLDWIQFNEPGFTPFPGHHWFHISDLLDAFSGAGLSILKIEGFEPRIKGNVCPPEESHSVYILARKEV